MLTAGVDAGRRPGPARPASRRRRCRLGAGGRPGSPSPPRWPWLPCGPMTMPPEGDDAGAAPSAFIETISIRLVIALGFSNGWAELALKMPPPLVPSCLIASWLAAGIEGDGLLAALERMGA